MERYLDLTLVMNRALDVFKQKWLKLSALVLLMYAVVLVPFGLWYLDVLNSTQALTHKTETELLNMFDALFLVRTLGLLVGIALCMYVTMLLYKTILSVAKGKTISLETSTVVNYFVVTIIVGIIAAVSMNFCYIPFFIIYPRVMLAPIYIIDNPKMGIGDAIEQSWNATKDNIWKLLLLGVIARLISYLGALLLGVGALPAEAFVNVMLVMVYLILSGQDELAQDDVTPQEETFVVEEKTVCRD